ncbi:MAG: GIY-YIG nuclease family protein [Acidobacteriota bacterium]
MAKHVVYVLQSVPDPTRPYIGLTSDLEARLAAHNAGRCRHTARYRPWEVVVALRADAVLGRVHDAGIELVPQ